ncbi:MAG TPA: hypothetical protein VEH51_04700 [Burkholderiales bacterium]|nr:hypothetical protein [Burkholderiales bacterium]
MKTAIGSAALCAALLGGAVLLPGAQGRELSATHHVVNGMDVYLGVMPAAAVQALPAREQAERAMHRGPAGASGYHVNLSLFDARTHAAIRDAQVRVSVEQAGASGETRQLEPMSINGFTSYGNYFSMSNGSQPYLIDVLIDRPGLPEAHTRFQYQTF